MGDPFYFPFLLSNFTGRIRKSGCIFLFVSSDTSWHEAKAHAQFKGTLNTLLDTLNNIKLSTLLEETKSRGRVKATYQLEEMSDEESLLMNALGIMDFHKYRLKLQGLSVYN